MKFRLCVPLLALTLIAPAVLAQVRISEFMASNTKTVADDFGQFEDWIEIYNFSTTNVAMQDWSLTDTAGDPSKWRFPNTNLPPRTHLVVWASNRNRTEVGAPLHTNFKLDPSGEYLALVRPDGSIATRFSPQFPAQMPDVSYGFGTAVAKWNLVSAGSAGRVKVPLDDLLDLMWFTTNLNDSSWAPVTNGIGFETGASEFPTNAPGDVYADAPVGFWRLNELNTNGAALNTGAIGTPGNGQFNAGMVNGVAGPRPGLFPGFESANYAARFNGANSTVDVPYSAALNPNGPVTVECWVKPGLLNARQCPVSSINFTTSSRAGYLIYQNDLNAWEFRLGNNTASYVAIIAGGVVQTGVWQHVVGVYDGASATLYVNGVNVGSIALSGAYVPNTAGPFRLGATGSGSGTFFFNGDIDEVAMFNRALSGGEIAQRYEIATTAILNYGGLIRSDVRAAMHGVNSSVYYRLPFTLTNATELATLTLRAKYDDGFTVFLNGVPVLGRNAPSMPVWSSAAASRRSTTDVLQFEEIDLSGQLGLLKNGTNVLALQGLNVASNNPDFLLLPELEVSTVGEYQDQSRFFVLPTPGGANGGGTADLGPIIADTGFWPPIPGTNDSITVTCRVAQAYSPVASVSLSWRVMYGVTNSALMFDDGLHGDSLAGDGIYGAVITNKIGTIWNYSAGQMVRWFISSADSLGRPSRWPLFEDPAASAEYLGTVIQPDYVSSRLPIVHMFVSNYTAGVGVDDASKAGGRASIYFDGEFYDNVFMRARGNSTIGYQKKSHSVYFNREHQFRHPGPGGRVRKTSWTADYPDPTYMRQGLSFWLCEQMGAPGPYYYPMRLQMNGAFYQLANHNDLHGEELLDRLSYDSNGALYNAAGTVVPGQFSTGGFDKKTRQWEGNADYQALANAISESLTVGQRRTNIFDLLDLPEVINYLAAARFVHENDDVWANMSLYHDNDGDGLWRIIPFDMNLSWGAAYVDSSALQGIQATNDSLKSFPLYGSSQAVWTSGGNWNRIYDVIFSVPETREMFLRRLRTLLDTYVKPPGTPANQLVIEPLALAWRDLIGVEAQIDRAAWGWPAMGGQCNFNPGIQVTNGVDILINDFIGRRREHFYGKHSVTNLALPIGITKADNAGIPLAQPANPVVSILSWDYNPASGNQDEEFVCLTNANSYAVDISGWKLDGGVACRLRPGTVIPANSALFLTPNVVAFRSRASAPKGGMGLLAQGNYSGHLNAWGETLTLANAAGSIVSSNSFVGIPSAAQRYLRITEIMYNPAPLAGNAADPQLFEFIELRNISSNITLNLSGTRLTNGVYFDFTGSAVSTLLPGQTVLVVRDSAAFASRYGGGFNIAGQYTGALDNSGETIRLEDAAGEKILEFAYNNTWYPITDGLGFSLVIVDEQLPWSSWGDKASWKAGGYRNGSPGAAEPAPPAIGLICVNEVLAHTDLPEVDVIELFNPTSASVNIGGWLLTDDFFTPAKYRIPNGTAIPAGGYLSINAEQFGVGSAGFLLSEYGEQAFLFSADASTNLTGYVHGFNFSVSPNGVSFGRYLTSEGREHFVLQSATSLGTNNAAPRVGPIVISEIMYHPPDLTNGADNALDEYIELQNISGTNVPLYCTFTNEPGYGSAALTNTWRLRSAVDFDFPANRSLAAGGRLLVVGFDPTNATQLAAFRALYGVAASVPVYGPWNGKLNNSSDSVELKSPEKPDVTATNVIVPYYMVDQIDYDAGPVWPSNAIGLGNSIQRVTLPAYGNDPTNWAASGPTAGRSNAINLPPQVTLVTPADGAGFNRSQTITISATASDPDGTVSGVEFYADGNLLATRSTAPWSYAWNGAPFGVHSLTARAVDDGGSVAISPAISISVTSQPPTVSLTAPASGAVVVSGSTVPIIVTAADVDGSVVGVDLYANGSSIASLTAAPWNFNWLPAVPGNCVITAMARDDSGASSLPASSAVWVQASLINPVAISLGSSWRYQDNGVDPGPNWMLPGFSDGGWPIGNGKLGFYNNNAGLGTVLSYGTNSNNKHTAYYFRKAFVVPTLSGITNLYLETLRDDGVAVYLNGAPLYRNNLPAGTLTYSQLATNCSDNGTVLQTAILSTNGLLPGTNIIAAEIHQSSITSSDVAFDLKLTLLGIQIGPGIVLQPQSQQVEQNAAATFAVGAVGSEPLTYQWKFNGVDIGGANSSSYTLTSAQPSQAGLYSVLVANPVGSVVSSEANLAVAGAPNPPITLEIRYVDGSIRLTWTGGLPPFQAQSAADLDPASWQNLESATTNRTMTILPSSSRAFFRVLGSR